MRIRRSCNRNSATVDPNTKVNLQQLLGSLAAQATTEQADNTPLLMKAAEHMAIRFALERFQKGEVKVNAVHQMMEHMSRQMDTLRQILKIQEDKMSKAGILVESHADILDRMFWAEVPEAGKKSVLLSHEAPCVPPRNVRQFVEVLLERGDKETSVGDSAKLSELSGCQGKRHAPQDRDRREPAGRPVRRHWRRADGALRHENSAKPSDRNPTLNCKAFWARRLSASARKPANTSSLAH